jgi:hypothetical protein
VFVQVWQGLSNVEDLSGGGIGLGLIHGHRQMHCRLLVVRVGKVYEQNVTHPILFGKEIDDVLRNEGELGARNDPDRDWNSDQPFHTQLANVEAMVRQKHRCDG